MLVRAGLVRMCSLLCVVALCSSWLLNCGGQECYFDTACGSGQVCKEGKCVAGVAPTCTKDGDCTAPRRCVSTRCVSLPTGFEFPTPGEAAPEKTPEKTPDTQEVSPPDQEVVVDTGEPVGDAAPPESTEPNPEEPPRTPCKSDKDCASIPGTVCAPHSKDALSCQPLLASGESLSAACDPADPAPGVCKSLVCHPGKYCTTPCADDSDCPGGAGACVEETLPSGGKFKLCNDQSDNQCLNDQHCGKTFQCIIREARVNVASTQCSNGIGSGRPGDACIGHSECSYNICIERRYCSKTCLTDSECQKPYVCATNKIEYPEGSGRTYNFRLCQLPLEGLPCKLSQNCLLTGNQCSPKDVNGSLELRCQKPIGNKRYRESCASDADCLSNYCFSGSCSEACEQDADCPAGGALPIKCLEIDQQRGNAKGKLKVCVSLRKDCTKDADCGAQETCAPDLDAAGTLGMKCIPRFDQSGKANNETCQSDTDCQSRRCNNNTCAACAKDADCATGTCVIGVCTTAKALGADCAKATDCQSRICFQKLCSLACSNNSDCNTTGYGCTSETITEGANSFMGQLCTIPQGGLPCFTSADCPSAQAKECSIIEVNGKPVTRCRAKVGTKTNGEACTQDSDCQSGTCLQPDGTCTQSCTQQSDCTQAQRCHEREFKPSGGGTPVQIKVCALTPCQGDANCEASQLCVFFNAGTTPYLRCVTPDSSKKSYAATCTQDSDCQSGLCSGGTAKVCVPACEGGKSESCPLQYACESTATGTKSTHLCEPIADACTRSADCQTGQQCVLSFDAANRPVRTCQTVAASRKIGEVCDPKALLTLCESGLCDDRTSRCADLCVTDADCPTGGLYQCATKTFAKAQGQTGPDWSLKYCRSLACDHDGHCANSEVCQVSIIQSKVAKRCVTPSGGQPGASCTSHGDCASGLCQLAKCSALCAAHRHCATTDQCVEVQIIPGLLAKGCTPGSRSSCSSNADCLTGDVCQANFAGNGDAITECKKPKATDKADGQPCTPGSFPGECASHLCDSVTQRCLKTCDPKLEQLNDCKLGTEVCGAFPLLTRTVFACLPPPKACKKAADCSVGAACAAQLSQGTVSYLCQRPGGNQTKKVGDTCDPSKGSPGDCETQLCHPTLKICVNTCELDADCPTGRPRCGQIALDASGTLAKACIPDNSLCETNANCPTSQPVCALELQSNQLSKRCSAGGPGVKKTGETCDPDKNIPGDCVSRFCEEGTRQCVDTCEINAHCPQGLGCVLTFVEKTRQAKACAKPFNAVCTHRQDCPKPYTCVSSRETTSIVSKCQAATGADAGAACAPTEVTSGSKNYKLDPTCKSNLCHPNTQQCTDPCRTDADCVTGKCKSLQVEGFSVNVCDASCQKDSDCATGQVCGAELDTNGDIRPFCIIPKTGNKAAGATCDPTQARYAECQSGVCGPSTKTCLALCALDADCGAGQICDTTFARTSATTQKPILACVPDTGSCRKPADCITGYLCGAQSHGAAIVMSCFATAQADNQGTTCDPLKPIPGDCTTGLCDPKSNQCTTACDVTADCTDTLRSSCGTITIQSNTLKACVEP